MKKNKYDAEINFMCDNFAVAEKASDKEMYAIYKKNHLIELCTCSDADATILLLREYSDNAQKILEKYENSELLLNDFQVMCLTKIAIIQRAQEFYMSKKNYRKIVDAAKKGVEQGEKKLKEFGAKL